MKKENEVAEEKQEEKKEAKVVEVASEYLPAIQLEDGTIVNDRELLVRIYNKLNKIEKTL